MKKMRHPERTTGTVKSNAAVPAAEAVTKKEFKTMESKANCAACIFSKVGHHDADGIRSVHCHINPTTIAGFPEVRADDFCCRYQSLKSDCTTCRFYRYWDNGEFRCRRNPPPLAFDDDGEGEIDNLPEVGGGEFCGEYQFTATPATEPAPRADKTL